jgi:hypothetical protein
VLLRPTWLQHAATLSQLVPPLVAVAAGRLLPPGRRWIVIWCLSLVLQDGVSVAVAMQGSHNIWVSYVFLPLTGAIALWTLSLWQIGTTERVTLRLAIPIFVFVSVSLSILVDDLSTFSLVTAPYHAMVLLLAAMWTFVRRSLSETGIMLSQDWFWAVGGLMLYAATSTAIQPLAFYLLGEGREDLFHAALNVKAAIDVLAFAAIMGGMLCPVPPTFSGGSSSSPSSPSGSSSLPSARRW